MINATDLTQTLLRSTHVWLYLWFECAFFEFLILHFHFHFLYLHFRRVILPGCVPSHLSTFLIDLWFEVVLGFMWSITAVMHWVGFQLLRDDVDLWLKCALLVCLTLYLLQLHLSDCIIVQSLDPLLVILFQSVHVG